MGPNNRGSLNLTLKSHATKVFALRLGVSTYLGSNEGSTSYEGRTAPQSQDFTNAGLFLNFLFYTNPTKPFSFFAGFGPVYQYSLQTSDYESNYYFVSSSHTSQKEWSLGGFGVLGAEWFPHPRFSITGEYNFSYTLGNLNSTTTHISTPPGGPSDIEVYTTDLDVKTFNFNIVKLGITAYF